MELHQLRGFYEIAKGGSFTRAADRLYLTQPAISLQVKALEEELGQVLLDRTRQTARLTEAGEILFRQTTQIFEHLATAREEIDALHEVLRGRLVIGTSDTNCTYILPELLQRFRERFPDVELDMRNKMSPEVCQLVLDDEVDLALLPELEHRRRRELLRDRADLMDRALRHRDVEFQIRVPVCLEQQRFGSTHHTHAHPRHLSRVDQA